MQTALRRWLVPRTMRDDMIIHEQNLRVILLVLLPLAGFALLPQLTEWAVSDQMYLGVPISAFACLAILLLIGLTHTASCTCAMAARTHACSNFAVTLLYQLPNIEVKTND